MKLKLFLIFSAVVAAAYAVINPFLTSNTSTIQAWAVIVALGAMLPAVIAFIAQRESLKVFISDYLSFKRTNWRSAINFIAVTALILPIFAVLMTFIFGNLLQIEAFGSGVLEGALEFNTNLLGFIPFTITSTIDIVIAVVAQIIYLLIFGTVVGIFNCIFEEIAWRGFLVKYLNSSTIVMALVSGSVWTLWWLAMTYVHCNTSAVIITTTTNFLLSYYLVRVVRATGSVWTSAMIRGVFSLGTMPFCWIPGTNIGIAITTLTALLVIIALTSRIKATA